MPPPDSPIFVASATVCQRFLRDAGEQLRGPERALPHHINRIAFDLHRKRLERRLGQSIGAPVRMSIATNADGRSGPIRHRARRTAPLPGAGTSPGTGEGSSPALATSSFNPPSASHSTMPFAGTLARGHTNFLLMEAQLNLS